MYKYFFIAGNNMRKQRGDMITFFVLTAIASLLIFVSVTFLSGTARVIDTARETINGSDILILFSGDDTSEEKIKEIIRGQVYLGDYESNRYLNASGKYRKKGEKSWTEYPFNICSYEDERKIQRISADTRGLSGAEAVIPVSLSTSYDIGDTLQLKIGDNIYDLKVAGFNEDTLYCSPVNMGTYLVFVSDKMYEDILFENAATISESSHIKVNLTNTARKKHVDTIALCDDIGNEYLDWSTDYKAAHPEYEPGGMNVLPFELMKTASMILPFVFIALVLVFALIIFIIAIVIINFSVKNFIMTNLKNTAIMEASGYTVRELILILLFQLVIVAGAGSFCGVLEGTALIDKLKVIILITLGLSWNQPVNPVICISVVIGICFVIAVLTFVIGREYNRISVLDALRGGINAHNYKKNYFAFDKTAFPVAVTLSLKETFGRFKSQIGIIFIMVLLTISTMVGFGMVDSYGRDEQGIINMGGFIMSDATVTGDTAMADNIASMSTVSTVYRDIWTSLNFYNGKNMQSLTTRAFSDTSVVRGGGLVEGRWPSHPNEVMFATNAASRLNVNVGDAVTIKNKRAEESYIVCGLCQTMNNMGMMAYMTMDGINRMMNIDGIDANINIDLKKGRAFDDFEKELRDVYPDIELSNVAESIKSTIGMVTTGLKAVAVFIAGLTILIVAFVESLIIRTHITRSWRDMGVSKALGYTSGQLILQTVLSNLPSIVIGVLTGLLLSPMAVSSAMTAIFAIFGFRDSLLRIRPASFILAAFLIIGVAILTSALMGRRIKGLEPVKMITEE